MTVLFVNYLIAYYYFDILDAPADMEVSANVLATNAGMPENSGKQESNIRKYVLFHYTFTVQPRKSAITYLH